MNFPRAWSLRGKTLYLEKAGKRIYPSMKHRDNNRVSVTSKTGTCRVSEPFSRQVERTPPVNPSFRRGDEVGSICLPGPKRTTQKQSASNSLLLYALQSQLENSWFPAIRETGIHRVKTAGNHSIFCCSKSQRVQVHHTNGFWGVKRGRSVPP